MDPTPPPAPVPDAAIAPAVPVEAGGNGKLKLDAAESRIVRELLERLDGWQNIMTNLGIEGKDARIASQFVLRKAAIGRETYSAMYQQDAIFARIVDAIPEHLVRRWVRLTVFGTEMKPGAAGPRRAPAKDDSARAMMTALKELGVREAIKEANRLDRLDGGSAIIIGAKDNKAPSEELDLASVQKIEFLNVLTRYEIYPGPRNRNPMSPNFRKPDYYTTTPALESGEAQNRRIHHSRVIRWTGIRTTERTDEERDGWGLPVVERVYESLRQYGTAYGYVEALCKDLVQAVMTIKGLNHLVAHDEENGTVIKRLALIGLVASAFNAVVLDEDEKYERRTQPLNGIPEILVKFMDKLAADAEMPLSILFGQAPTGLSTDDKSGRTTFYDSISNKFDSKARPALERIITILWACKEGPTKGQIPESWEVEPLPLMAPTDEEDAKTRYTRAQTTHIYVQDGVITPEEGRTALINDPASPYALDEDPPEPEDPEPDPELEEDPNADPNPGSEDQDKEPPS